MNGEPYSGAALKRSAWHFLTGRAASAALTFIILLWVVRLLSVAEYGAYVTLVAALELAIAISTLGLPWMASRYLPEYRLHAPGVALIRYTWQIMALLGGLLILAALLLLTNLQWLLAAVDMSSHEDAAKLYLLMLIAEGFGRHLRESALGPLLKQGVAQISLVMRNLVLLLLLGVAAAQPVHLRDVVRAELIAAAVAAVFALGGLVRHLRQHRDLKGEPAWMAPTWQAMWHTARHMYFSQMITLAYSTQVFLILIRHYLGVEATAAFGFLRNLYEQVSRYLPATLLFGLIRPKLVASYVGKGGVEELARNANLAGKLSLFVLMPLVVFVGLGGEELIGLLANGKFPDTGWYLFGLMLALIPFSQRQIVETVAVTSGLSQLCTFAAALGVLMLPLTYLLLEAGLGLWAPIIGLGVGNLLFNAVILVGIGRLLPYRPDMSGFIKLMLASFTTYLAARFIPLPQFGWIGLISAGVFTLVTYLIAAYLIRPFAQAERDRLNRHLARGLFVW
jgi:O-antigen/teichoic acid export membrane protein